MQGQLLEAVRFILQRYTVHITMVKSPKIRAKIAVQISLINTTNTSQCISYTVNNEITQLFKLCLYKYTGSA